MVAWIPEGSGTADTVPSRRKSSIRQVPWEDSAMYPYRRKVMASSNLVKVSDGSGNV